MWDSVLHLKWSITLADQIQRNESLGIEEYGSRSFMGRIKTLRQFGISFRLHSWGEGASEIFVVEGTAFSVFSLPVSCTTEVGKASVPKHNPLYFVGGFVSFDERWMCNSEFLFVFFFHQLGNGGVSSSSTDSFGVDPSKVSHLLHPLGRHTFSWPC